MNTLQKKSYLSLFIIVLLQIVFFYLIYLEYRGEKKLVLITQSDKVDKGYKNQVLQLSDLINNSQIHFNQYVLYREVPDLESYNSDLMNMSSRLGELLKSKNQSITLSNKLKNNMRLSNSLIELKYKTDSLIRQKSIFNNQIQRDVLEKPVAYQFEDVLNSVEFETDKKVDSVKKKGFFSRLGSAMKGETEVQKEQINSVLKMKFGKKIISGDIKQQFKNVLIESQKHYNKQFKELSLGLDNIKKAEKSLINKNASLVKLYRSINLELNSLVDNILNENSLKIDEQSRLNKEYRFYLLLTVLSLVILMAILLVKYLNETFKIKKELATANNQVTKDLILKNRIITTLTHEIKTPVSIISLYGAFMRDKNLEPDLKEFFDTITYTSNTLQYISSQAVELVKSDKEELTLHLERINLTDQSKKIVNSLSIFASSKNIDLKLIDEINQDFELHYDIAKFYQLVYNIIGNAIKFAKSKVEVTIALENENDKTQFIFQVIDDGLGMSKMEVEKAFDFEYQNKRGKSVDTLSFGLGLYLCKKIIELSKGEILVESEINKGTKVLFKLNK